MEAMEIPPHAGKLDGPWYGESDRKMIREFLAAPTQPGDRMPTREKFILWQNAVRRLYEQRG